MADSERDNLRAKIEALLPKLKLAPSQVGSWRSLNLGGPRK